MILSPRLYFRDVWITVPFSIALCLQIIMWWYTLYYIHPANQQFFLHYSSLFGVDLVGGWWKVFYMPAVGLGLWFLNCVVSFLLFNSNRFIARLVALLTPGLELLLGVVLALIVNLNN